MVTSMKDNNRESVTGALFRQLELLSGALSSKHMNAVWFSHEGRTGYVRLWEAEDIVEMGVTDSQGIDLFWNHFSGKDALLFYDHIHAFFQVLYGIRSVESIQRKLQARPLKLLIVCTSGMTSSFVAARINELAGQRQFLVEAESCDMVSADRLCRDADVVLCAPQAAEWFAIHQYDGNTAMISPYDFGTVNLDGILSQVQRMTA